MWLGSRRAGLVRVRCGLYVRVYGGLRGSPCVEEGDCGKRTPHLFLYTSLRGGRRSRCVSPALLRRWLPQGRRACSSTGHGAQGRTPWLGEWRFVIKCGLGATSSTLTFFGTFGGVFCLGSDFADEGHGRKALDEVELSCRASSLGLGSLHMCITYSNR